MKKKFFLLPCIAAVLTLAYTSYNRQLADLSTNFSLLNAECLAEAEHLGGNWYSGFQMSKIWVNSNSSWQLTEPWFSGGYTAHFCCINSNESTACNFSNEEGLCKNIFIRTAHK